MWRSMIGADIPLTVFDFPFRPPALLPEVKVITGAACVTGAASAPRANVPECLVLMEESQAPPMISCELQVAICKA